jgi:hypothetical protein
MEEITVALRGPSDCSWESKLLLKSLPLLFGFLSCDVIFPMAPAIGVSSNMRPSPEPVPCHLGSQSPKLYTNLNFSLKRKLTQPHSFCYSKRNELIHRSTNKSNGILFIRNNILLT